MGDRSLTDILSQIRDVADYPEPGIVFKDITPLLRDGDGLSTVIDALADPWRGRGIDVVAGIEARGFIFGAPVALALGAGFVPIRKAAKLPGPTLSERYGLEYGTDTIEIHADAVGSGDHVLVLDDVLATGGTAKAAAALIERGGATVAGLSFLLELDFLAGRERIDHYRIESLLRVEA